MTCHFLRHHPAPSYIPQLACHRHQGLHFRPSLWDRWSQRLEISSGEGLPSVAPVPLALSRCIGDSQYRASSAWVSTVQSEVGMATQVSTKPAAIWSSSRKA